MRFTPPAFRIRASYFVIGFAMLLCSAALLACSDPPGSTKTPTSGGGSKPSAAVEDGQQLYTAECASCHGDTGDRIPIAPLNSKPFLDTRGDATLLAVVGQGKGTMPAFSDGRGGPFTDDQVRSVVAYLNSLAGRASTTLLADVGQALYSESCESCHGPTGDRIPIAPLDAKGFLDSRTDTALSDAILKGTGAMRGFGSEDGGPLTQEDATALISFLRYRVQEVTAKSVSRGRDLYVGNCLTCHGNLGNRVPDVALGDGAYLEKLGDGALIAAVNQGTETGPAFGIGGGGAFEVTDTAALLAYLKSWAGLNVTAALSLPLGGGPGEGLFVANCAPCHGITGDQVPGVQLRSATFLESVTRDVVTRTVKVGNDKGMPAWGVDAGGPLTDQDVDSVVEFLFSSASGAPTPTETPTGSETPSASETPAGTETPLARDPILDEKLFDGKTASEFFGANCAGCHGANREGIIGPALLPERLDKDDQFYIDTITNGRPGTPMPAWGQQGVTPEQIKALVVFIKTPPDGGSAPAATATPDTTETPAATPTTAAIDIEAPIFDGKKASEFFAANCAVCHGDKRQGVIGPALLPERLTQDDQFYVDTITNGRPGTPMPAWGQQGMTEDQIRTMVAFIKTPLEGAETPAETATPGGGDTTLDLTSPIFDGKPVAEFFAGNCAACHGDQRQGIIGPALLPERLTEDDQFYIDTITNGRPGTPMPSWKERGLTDEQIKMLVAFIKSPPGGEPVTSNQDPLSTPAPILMGADLFGEICSKCHGTNGLQIPQCPIGSREFLSNMSFEGLIQRISRGKPGAGMPTWSEEYGGPLTKEQILSVAEYLGENAQ